MHFIKDFNAAKSYCEITAEGIISRSTRTLHSDLPEVEMGYILIALNQNLAVLFIKTQFK